MPKIYYIEIGEIDKHLYTLIFLRISQCQIYNIIKLTYKLFFNTSGPIMKNSSRLDIEREIIRSLQPLDKTIFGKSEMTTRAIDQNHIDNLYRLDKNLIIYQFEVVSSDKICMIINNQNLKNVKWI